MIIVPVQLSVAVTALSFGAGTAAAHWTVTSGGMLVITGGVVSLTMTSVVHATEQPPMVLGKFNIKVNGAAQADPALTVTVWELVGPEMEPFPVTDQE